MGMALPASRRLPRAEREAQILDVAHAQFGEHGYAAVTMDSVASAVGVTKPLLYNYWGNKERLYLACLERDADDLVEAITGAVGHAPSPAEALAAGMSAFFAFVEEDRAAFRVLFDETLPAGGEIGRQVAAYRRRITDIVAGSLLAQMEPATRKRARVEVQALSEALLGAAEALARWWLREQELSAADTADLLITTVAPGLRERSERRTTSKENS